MTEITTHSIEIFLNPLADDIKVQLDKQGFKYQENLINGFEKCREAICMLYYFEPSIINAAQYSSASNKLYKQIVKHVCKVNKLTIK